MGGLGAPEIILILIALGFIFVFPLWGYSEGKKRSVGAVGGLLLGLFLGLLGIIIVYCSRRIDEPNLFSYNPTPQSSADELKKYKDLLDSGAITEQEYNQQKRRLLGGGF